MILATSRSLTPRPRLGPRPRFVACAVVLLAAARLDAQALGDLVPRNAAHCGVTTPPPSAGIAPTPGGFVMVFPRDDAIDDTYTGCKILWVVDTDRMPRLATLYFVGGKLSRGVAHDVRDPAGAPSGACAFPEGRPLPLPSGRAFGVGACQGLLDEALFGLRVATWPRSCLETPDAAVCRSDE